MFEQLKDAVCRANRELARRGLVTLTWGNASGISPDRTRVAIKPSGVAYDDLTAERMVVVDLEGNVVEGRLRPSSDTPTHLLLYRSFQQIGGVAHTHSPRATAFAQARLEIPCLGTTHADHFSGPVPVTRPLTAEEVEEDYERNTGKVIIERFVDLDPRAMPAVLAAGHGPFCWGRGPLDAVATAAALEAVAAMALATRLLRPESPLLEDYPRDKHFRRKQGPGASYGQK